MSRSYIYSIKPPLLKVPEKLQINEHKFDLVDPNTLTQKLLRKGSDQKDKETQQKCKVNAHFSILYKEWIGWCLEELTEEEPRNSK